MSIFTTLDEVLEYLGFDPKTIPNKYDENILINVTKTSNNPTSKITLNNKEYNINAEILKLLIGNIKKTPKITGFTISDKGTVYYFDDSNKLRTTIDNLEQDMCKHLNLKTDCKSAVLSCILNTNKDCLKNITDNITNNIHDFILDIEMQNEDYQLQYKILFYSFLFQLGWYGIKDQLVDVDNWSRRYDFHNIPDKLKDYLNELVEFINNDPKFVEKALIQTKRLISDLDTKEYRTNQLLHALNKRYRIQKLENAPTPNLTFPLPWIVPFKPPLIGNLPGIPGVFNMSGGGDLPLYNYYNQKYINLKQFLEDYNKKLSKKNILKYESTLKKLYDAEININQNGGSSFNYIDHVITQIKNLRKMNANAIIMLDHLDMLPTKLIIYDKKSTYSVEKNNYKDINDTRETNSEQILINLVNLYYNRLIRITKNKGNKIKVASIKKDLLLISDELSKKLTTITLINNFNEIINKIKYFIENNEIELRSVKDIIIKVNNYFDTIQNIISRSGTPTAAYASVIQTGGCISVSVNII